MFEAEITRLQKAVDTRFDEVDATLAGMQAQMTRGFRKTRKSIRNLHETVSLGFIELGLALTAQMADMEQRFQREIDRVNRRIDDIDKAS